MGGFASKGQILETAVDAVLLRHAVHENALKSRAESMQIVRDGVEAERVSTSDVNEFINGIVDRGLIQALLLSLQDLHQMPDEDLVLDNVLLNVQTLGLLGKFIEAQETFDRLGVPDTLKSKVLPRYTFDAVLKRDITVAVCTMPRSATIWRLACTDALCSTVCAFVRSTTVVIGVVSLLHLVVALTEWLVCLCNLSSLLSASCSSSIAAASMSRWRKSLAPKRRSPKS